MTTLYNAHTKLTSELKADVAELKQQCSKLQSSLTQALDEADELRGKNQEQAFIMRIMETELDSLRVDQANLKRLNDELRERLNAVDELTISKLNTDLIDEMNTTAQLDDRISELEALNTIANKALTDVAKQLGFESFVYEDVMSAIADLYDQIEGRETALRGSVQAIEEWQRLAEKRKKSGEEWAGLYQEIEDNLTRSNSDRLSELTSILRIVQALSDTPQDCYYGASRLIRQVIYNAICKLDPSQSFDV